MKKSKQTIFSIVFLLIVHTVLCDIYNYTYFSNEFDFAGKFTGVVYWAILIGTFLAGPFIYYIAGRLRKNKGDKKLTVKLVFIINILAHIYPINEPMKAPNIIPAYIPFKPHPNVKQNKYAHTISNKSDLIIVRIKLYNPFPIALNNALDISPWGIAITYKLNIDIVDAIRGVNSALLLE